MVFRWRWQSFFKRDSRFSLLLLGLLTCLVSSLLGMGLAGAVESPYGMVDPIDARYEAGYATYLSECATCHVALPPAILPADTWQTLVTDSAHYGVTLPAIGRFEQQLMLSYLQTYSRRHTLDGPVPYRLQDSAYFHALHPGVALPQPLNLQTCVGCHLSAREQDYSALNAIPQ